MTKEEIIRNYGSLSLAYIGDAAYELAAREYLLKSGMTDNGKMHVKTKTFVSAHAQNLFLQVIAPLLTDDELAVVRRGRNVKSRSHPKNADISEYHGATGFEALWGYLYLSGDRERMANLFEIIVNTNSKAE